MDPGSVTDSLARMVDKGMKSQDWVNSYYHFGWVRRMGSHFVVGVHKWIERDRGQMAGSLGSRLRWSGVVGP